MVNLKGELNMRHNLLGTVLLSMLVGLFVTAMSVSAAAGTKPVRETSTTVNALSESRESKYYRLNRAKKTKLRFSGAAGEGQVIRRITLPKGTVVTDGSVYDNPLMNDTPDLSYYVKRHTYAKGAYGTGFLPAMFTFNKSGLTRIKRPAYLFPNQTNYFYTGGLKAFGDDQYHSNLVKITTDGYVEYYRYHPVTFTEEKKSVTFDYRQKPTSYVKIQKTLKKGAKTYLYFKSNLKGVNDKHIHKTGNYRYRLTINNLHTPYSRINPTVNFRVYASLYTFGGQAYYSIAAL